MGSIGNVLAGAAKEGLSSVAEHAPDLWSKFGPSMDTVMKQSEHGAVVAGHMQDFVKVRDQSFQKLEAPVKKLWDGIGKDSNALTGGVNTKTSTVADLHQHLSSKAHPLAQHTNDILMQNVAKNGQSKNASLTLQELSGQNHAQANLLARLNVLGPHSENIIPSVEALFKSEDPKDNAMGQYIIDSVANITRDNTTKRGATVSSVKSDVRDMFEKKNRVNAKYQTGATRLNLPDTKAIYTETSRPEAAAHSFLVNRMADWAAIAHLSMLGNLASAPMADIAKGLMSLRDPEMKEMIQASGALSQTMHSMFDKQIRGANSVVGQLAGRSAGELFYKGLHMPLFDTMRFHQLSLGASVGYHSAITWAAKAVQGDKRAIAELAEMRLDPQDIIKRGGQLTDSELQTAMYHYANNKFFISRPMDQTLMANSNAFMRSATMFHKTINSQFYFMKNEIVKMAKAGDIKGLVQFAGTLGILFPYVAPWIKSLTMLARTASPQQSEDDLKKSYGNLFGQNGFGDFASSYGEMLSYIGGVGVFHSYIQAAHNDRFTGALVGPPIAEAGTVIQDTINAATKTNKHGIHNLAPLARDASELSVPVVGKWLGYKLFPTKSKTGKSTRRRH